MAVPTFTIAGANRTTRVHAIGSLGINYVLGARATARFKTLDLTTDSTAAAYAPDTDETIAITEGATALFTGKLDSKKVRGLGEHGSRLAFDLEAIDVSEALDYRLVNGLFYATSGWTLKGIVDYIVTNYLSVYGITLDPGMATGPTLTEDVPMTNVTVRDGFNYLVSVLGGAWVYRITPAKVLEWFTIGTKTAAYSLTTAGGAILGDVTWSKQRRDVFNRVILEYGGTKILTKRINMTSPLGTTTTFPLDYIPVYQFSGPVVSSGVVVENTNNYYPLNGPVAGVLWVYDSVTNSLVRSPALPAGTPAYWDFAVQFPQNVIVQDAADVAVNGPRETKIKAGDITDRAAAESYGNGILARSRTVSRTLTVRTRQGMEFPGTVIPLTIAERSVGGNWLITETRVKNLGNDILEYEFSCLEGAILQQSWVDFVRSSFGRSGSFGAANATLTGTFSPAASGFFSGDIVANSGLDSATTGAEVTLRGVIPGKALKQGPGVMLGRPENAHAWSISADMLSGGPTKRNLLFSPESQKTNVFPWAMALLESPVAGEEYYLVPPPNRVLGIGGHPSVFGITGYGVRVHATDITSEAGIFEWGRSYRSGTPQSYTPTWGNTGTANTVGNATITGRYSKQGNKVSFDIGFVFGSTSVGGNGLFTFSFPSTLSTNSLSCFTASILDAGARYFMAVAEPYTTSVLVLAAEGGSNVTRTTPMIWATGDSLRISGWYYEP